jgi:hypothetical protein
MKHVDYLQVELLFYDYANVSINALLMKFITHAMFYINDALKFIFHVEMNHSCINGL